MLDLVTTTQFRKDLRKLRKRGADMQKLDDVLQMLCVEKQLPERYRDHALVGDYIGFRECPSCRTGYLCTPSTKEN